MAVVSSSTISPLRCTTGIHKTTNKLLGTTPALVIRGDLQNRYMYLHSLVWHEP